MRMTAIPAAIGIAINLGTALMFVRGRKSDINVRGAYLHMAAELWLDSTAGWLAVVDGRFGYSQTVTPQATFSPLIGLLPQVGIALVLLVGGREVIAANQSVITDLSKLGKPGTHFVHDFFLPGTQLTFPQKQTAKIASLAGVASISNGLVRYAKAAPLIAWIAVAIEA